MASHWIAGTLLITAEIACHLFPLSFFWWLCCQLRRVVTISNYFSCKILHITIDLIHACVIKYVKRIVFFVFFHCCWGFLNDKSPFEDFLSCWSQAIHLSFAFFSPVIIVRSVLSVYQSIASCLRLMPQSLFIDIYMRWGPWNDLDLSNALMEFRPPWTVVLVWD